MRSTRGTHNPNLQVVITHASPYVAVWTSIKYEWNAQNAICHAHLNILSLELITCVLTVSHVKLTQSTAMEQKRLILTLIVVARTQ